MWKCFGKAQVAYAQRTGPSQRGQLSHWRSVVIFCRTTRQSTIFMPAGDVGPRLKCRHRGCKPFVTLQKVRADQHQPFLSWVLRWTRRPSGPITSLWWAKTFPFITACRKRFPFRRTFHNSPNKCIYCLAKWMFFFQHWVQTKGVSPTDLEKLRWYLTRRDESHSGGWCVSEWRVCLWRGPRNLATAQLHTKWNVMVAFNWRSNARRGVFHF